MIDDPRNPDAPKRRRGQVRENRGIFDRDLLLIIVAICNPGLDLCAIQRAGDQALMKGVLVVVTLLADRIKARDEAGEVGLGAANEFCLSLGRA
jgi:hypothetical protein